MDLPQMIIWTLICLSVGALLGVGLVGLACRVIEKETHP